MMPKKLSGVYYLENSITCQKYIGSSLHIQTRFSNHKSLLKMHKHHNLYLQHSWNKYGEINFIFRILELIDETNLECAERYWIEFYKSYDRKYGFNFIRKAERGSKTFEIRLGQRERMLGNTLAKGVSARPEMRELRRKMKLGSVQSKEIREKIRIANTGHVHSLETKNKISMANKGQQRSVDFKTRRKELMLGNKINLGRKASEETKAKLRLIRKSKNNKTIWLQNRNKDNHLKLQEFCKKNGYLPRYTASNVPLEEGRLGNYLYRMKKASRLDDSIFNLVAKFPTFKQMEWDQLFVVEK